MGRLPKPQTLPPPPLCYQQRSRSFHLQYLVKQGGKMVDNKPITNDDLVKMLKISKDVDPIAKMIELAPTLNPNHSSVDTAVFLFELFAARLPNSKKIQNINKSLDSQFFCDMSQQQLGFQKSCLIQLQIQPYGNLKQKHYISFYRQAVNKPFTLYHSWIDKLSLQTWCSRLGTVQAFLTIGLFFQPHNYIKRWLEYWLYVNEDKDGEAQDRIRTMLLYMENMILTVEGVCFRWPN